MPEEINRILTDHVSSLLFCPTETAVENLKKEGITHGIHLVGDVMYDAAIYFGKIAEDQSQILNTLNLAPKSYLPCYCPPGRKHRRSQTIKGGGFN